MKMKMKKNNQLTTRGFAHPELLLAALVVAILVLVLFLFMRAGDGDDLRSVISRPQPTVSESSPPTPGPVSEETDVDTLEAELDATVIGDFEEDINSIQMDASEL